MTKQLIKNGNDVHLTPGYQIKNLDPANRVMFNPNTGFYLAATPEMILPAKIYRSEEQKAFLNLIKLEFLQTNQSLGVLLNGVKGTGKSLDAVSLCQDLGLPYIVIDNVSLVLSRWAEFLDFIGDPCFNNTAILLDEADKTLPEKRDKVAQILSWFSGTHANKHLFLLTTNDMTCLSDYMVNRLGRIKYRRNYYSFTPEVVEEVVKDMYQGEDLEQVLLFCKTLPFATCDNISNVCKTASLLPRDVPFEAVSSFFNLATKEIECNIYLLDEEGKRVKELSYCVDLLLDEDVIRWQLGEKENFCLMDGDYYGADSFPVFPSKGKPGTWICPKVELKHKVKGQEDKIRVEALEFCMTSCDMRD